ncbi:MAG: NAD(P)H-hydrate dehydratase [Pseudomonadota bacterium]|nr:NAD(P)H-hydrate dehydratase [Pseudomonadota bacterium]
MNDPASALYDAEQVRELERAAIAGGIASYSLMQRAGAACWALICAEGIPASLVVVVGSGNNGGDGYEIARLSRQVQVPVRVFSISEALPSGDAAIARQAWLAVGGEIETLSDELPASEWVVDAVFGIGLSRAPAGAAAQAIAAINAAAAAGAKVLAVDVPSGLDATSGCAYADCVRADLTLSFIGNKIGLWTGDAAEYCGRRVHDSLAIPASLFAMQAPRAQLLTRTRLQVLQRRPRNAHKGLFGHVLVIGGNLGMAGAALLAGRAALRAGAGLVSIATRTEHAAALVAAQPELMVHGVASADDLRGLVARASVIALGPGLGQDEWGRAMFALAISGGKPLVVDADALNLLARVPQQREDWVLTPHPGEAARLLGCTNAEVQVDRSASHAALQTRYGGAVVLKGAGTMVSADPIAICAHGNPGMAVAGMGDTLTGVIVAFIAQGLSPIDAAQCGVVAHAMAADVAAAGGERGLLPGDVISTLRGVVNPQ